MELNLDTGEGHYHIRGYDIGFIQINNEKIDHSVIVTPNKLINPWLSSMPLIFYHSLIYIQRLFYSAQDNVYLFQILHS